MAEISDSYISHISKQIGEAQLAEFLDYCSKPLRKSIRVNLLKITVKDFLNTVAPYHWQLEEIPWCPCGFWITRPEEEENTLPLGNTLEHLAGLFYIQEASSMLPAQALNFALEQQSILPKKILDMAASPGSKTTQLAALTKNNCLIIANEISASRVKSLYASLRRCGVVNYCLSHRDGRDFSSITQNKFDAILVDAPCGGEGTVRKDPTALKNWNYDALFNLSRLQKQLIDSAYHSLKPGGVLVYSTCTISREENQQVCEYLLEQTDCELLSLEKLFDGAKRALTSEGYLHVLPQYFDSEGFFVACFKKPKCNSTEDEFSNVEVSGNWQLLNHSFQQQFHQYLSSQFKFELESLKGQFLVKQIHNIQELWLFPENLSNYLLQALKPKRSGIRLAELRLKKNNFQFRLTHEFVIAYGQKFNGNCFQTNLQQARDFLMGKDLQKGDAEFLTGECVIKYQDFSLGMAKVINNRIKNNLPRELVKDRLNWLLE